MSRNTLLERLLAIVAYMPIFGFIVAFFLNNELKSKLVSFHLRQALGLWLLFFAVGIVISTIDHYVVRAVFYLFFLALLIFGIISAALGKLYKLPLLGNLFNRLFKSISH